MPGEQSRDSGPSGLHFPLVVGLTSELAGLIILAYFSSQHLVGPLSVSFEVIFVTLLGLAFTIWFFHVKKLTKT